MNSRYLGDSFDIVKRFFCDNIRALGYDVFVDPMFTDALRADEDRFYQFLGARNVSACLPGTSPSALFFDPDTGVREAKGKQHVSFDRLVVALDSHALVFAFDQSFSRLTDGPPTLMRHKLQALNARGCHGFYYDSQARFLFTTRDEGRLLKLRDHFYKLGLPEFRLCFPLEGQTSPSGRST